MVSISCSVWIPSSGLTPRNSSPSWKANWYSNNKTAGRNFERFANQCMDRPACGASIRYADTCRSAPTVRDCKPLWSVHKDCVMTTFSSLPKLGVGLNYQPGLRTALGALGDLIDFFEISPDLLCRERVRGGEREL